MDDKWNIVTRTIRIPINPPNDDDPVRSELQRITDAGQWQIKAKSVIEDGAWDLEFHSKFHTYWTVKGRPIREQINDDQLLISFLRIVLPKYTGSNMILYRGENIARWTNGKVGVCWSSNIKTAQMFGSGLNATKSGGVLLKCNAAAQAIIAGPSEHSNHLRESEFTLDTSLLTEIEEIERYPPSD